MAYTVAWNEAYPAGTTAANILYTIIQNKQIAIRERIDSLFGTSGLTSIDSADPYLPLLLKLGGSPTSKIIPGATSFAIRDSADARNNLLVAENGSVTVYKDLRVDTGQAYIDPTAKGNLGATPTFDWAAGNTQSGTLDVNSTFTLSNPIAGAFYTLELKQDGTGSRTVTWPASVKWAGGAAPTLTITAGRTDVISLYYNGTYYLGVLAGSDFDV